MSAIEKIRHELDSQRQSVLSIIGMIRSAPGVDAVQDIRAKAEAIKAWAKVHKVSKSLRLELLRVEIAALVRLVELDGLDELQPSEREAAEWFAAMSESDLNETLANYSNITTASGLYRSVQRDLGEARRYRAETDFWSRRFSSEPEESRLPDENDFSAARAYVADVATVLSDMVQAYSETGAPFTVQEMSDQLIEDAGLSHTLDFGGGPVREGLNHAVRRAVLGERIKHWDGLSVPRFITSVIIDDDGEKRFVRIPVQNARVGDVSEMVKLRQLQLEQDQAALNRLQRFEARLKQCQGSNVDANVHELISASMRGDAAA